jgi:hypothetical protein
MHDEALLAQSGADATIAVEFELVIVDREIPISRYFSATEMPRAGDNRCPENVDKPSHPTAGPEVRKGADS